MIANNHEEFFDAIHRCITDEELCMQLGKNARLLAEKEHDINVVTKNLIEFYKACCKE
jgi:glycosyltransferase involved in cell wall biosynthesis